MKKGFIFLGVLVILITLSAQAVGAAKADFDQKIYVSENETINDNFFRWGNEIIIDGTIEGDAILAANKIIINGEVQGDVIAVGNTIEINGEVLGNVRVVGGNSVTINSSIGKNLNIAADTATLNSEAGVGWTFSFIANTIVMKAPVGGSVYGYANNIDLDNEVGKNVTLFLGQEGKARLSSATKINGHLEYYGNETALNDAGAQISGNIIRKPANDFFTFDTDRFTIPWIYSFIISLFGTLLVGTILISIFPKWIQKFIGSMQEKTGYKMLWGLLYFFLIPLVCILAMITLIGIPLAMITMVIYMIIIYVSKIFIGVWLGSLIVNLIQKKNVSNAEDKRTPTLIWTMMLGTALFAIIASLEFIGPIFSFVGIVWVIGTGAVLIKQKIKK